MSKRDIELNTFLRTKPAPAIPPRAPPRAFERFSRIITDHFPQRILPQRNLNEELGDINYDPSGGRSCSPLIVVLVVSLIINIICVGVFLYQEFLAVDDIKLEEQCVLKKLIRENYVEIYNTDIFKESLTDKTCDVPIKRARNYVEMKINSLYQKELVKMSKTEETYEHDLDNLNGKIDITDLVMITQYFDKMIDGPHGCMASNCTILENRRHDKTSILCDFNYKAKFKED